MGWRELLGWCEVLNRQRKGAELSPDSWDGYQNDPWYQEQRRKREADRGR